MTTVKTTCAYCGVGCGVLATATGARSATIAGDPAHPANFGKLCSKGTHLGETIGLEGRLLHPILMQQSGRNRAACPRVPDARRSVEGSGQDAFSIRTERGVTH